MPWNATGGRATFDILRNERLFIFGALGPLNVKGGSFGKRASISERRAEERNTARSETRGPAVIASRVAVVSVVAVLLELLGRFGRVREPDLQHQDLK